MTPLEQMLLLHRDRIGIVCLGLFAGLFALYHGMVRTGYRFPLRPLQAFEQIRSLVSQSLESGQPFHVALGCGSWDTSMAEMLAGLTLFDYTSQRAGNVEQPAAASAGNPVAWLLAETIAERNGARGEPSCPAVTFYGPNPFAYAAGTSLEERLHQRTAHALLGPFGQEGLWLAEALPRQTPTIGGTSDPFSFALMHASIDFPFGGETTFSAGAYLHRLQHLGSLAAQDAMRLLVALAMIAGVILTSLGWGG